MDLILAAQLEGDSPFDDGPLTLSGRLTSWELKTSPIRDETLPKAPFKVAVYDGPTRVLDIGCDAGGWCYAIKKQHPDWIVEGLDDIARWVQERGKTYTYVHIILLDSCHRLIDFISISSVTLLTPHVGTLWMAWAPILSTLALFT